MLRPVSRRIKRAVAAGLLSLASDLDVSLVGKASIVHIIPRGSFPLRWAGRGQLASDLDWSYRNESWLKWLVPRRRTLARKLGPLANPLFEVFFSRVNYTKPPHFHICTGLRFGC